MLGCDLIEVERIKKLILKNNINDVFSIEEQQYCNKFIDKEEHYAGFFCAKEAFLKALGIGIKKGINLNEINIKHNENGKPYILLSNENINKFNLNNKKIELSISHIQKIAMAICLIL